MSKLTRFELSFLEPGEDPRFARVPSMILSQRVRDGVVAVWPKGGILYEQQIVLVSNDGRHTTVLRGARYSELKKLLQDGYSVVNGKYPEQKE